MPTIIESCNHIDFSPCIPDNPGSPICKKGHGWSVDCLKKNTCPDYEPSVGLTLEEVRDGFRD